MTVNTKEIDFNNPVVVDISITSPVVDFNIPTYGWMESVTLRQLPPYDTTREKVLTIIKDTLNTVEVVPYDNLAGYEDIVSVAGDGLKFCIDATMKTLEVADESTRVDTEFKSSRKDGSVGLTVSVKISQRVDTPEITALFNAK